MLDENFICDEWNDWRARRQEWEWENEHIEYCNCGGEMAEQLIGDEVYKLCVECGK